MSNGNGGKSFTLPQISNRYLGIFVLLAAGVARKFEWITQDTFSLLLTAGLALLGIGIRNAQERNQEMTEKGAAAATQAAMATTGTAPPSTVAEVMAAPPATLSATVAADAVAAKGAEAVFRDGVAEGVREAERRVP